MCILMVVHRVLQDYPIIVAANRDEYHDRPTQGPTLLGRSPRIWGGRDERAGGTWMGINEHAVVVGLTNRRLHAEQETDSERRSRGLVCLEALQSRTAAEAVESLMTRPPQLYNPFNLLVMDPDSLIWVAYDDEPTSQPLQPGLHILANGELNDFETVRLRRARQLLQAAEQTGLPTLLPFLEQVCRDHEPGVQNRETICMHRDADNYGTVSSTILALPSDGQEPVYRYAEGHPCQTPYAVVPSVEVI
jgi:uncharacterized protein with NRDE domain